MISRYRSSRPGMTLTPPLRSETEDIAGTVERIGQSVDIVFVVVQIEAGAGGGVDAEQAHQRLGAVMTGAAADVALIEHRGQIARVAVAETEAEGGTALVHIGGPVEADLPTDFPFESVNGI